MSSNISFSIKLIAWYRENKRELPWRETKNPYSIWISEIILQQTRIEQGMSYFYRFIDKFPDIYALARANESVVLKYWEGLGYYSRARNLHFAAKQIVSNFSGIFPGTYNDIIKLKGVGEYTAAAIASIVFSEPIAAIDGNVYRVLSRLFTDDTPINIGKGKKRFKDLAAIFFDKAHPGEYNQAMMELGALICKPKNPKCDLCPVMHFCEAAQNSTMENYPVKNKKTKVKEVYMYYLVAQKESQIALQKRTGKGIWQNMYEFPLIESSKNLHHTELNEQINHLLKSGFQIKKQYQEIIHILSHRKLHVNFILVETQSTQLEFFDKQVVNELPFPIVIANFIKENF